MHCCSSGGRMRAVPRYQRTWLKKAKYAIPQEECRRGAHLPFLGRELAGR